MKKRNLYCNTVLIQLSVMTSFLLSEYSESSTITSWWYQYVNHAGRFRHFINIDIIDRTVRRSLTLVELGSVMVHAATYGAMRVSCRISWGGVFNPEQILMPLNITANGSQFPSWWPDYVPRYQTGICGLFVRGVCVRMKGRERGGGGKGERERETFGTPVSAIGL